MIIIVSPPLPYRGGRQTDVINLLVLHCSPSQPGSTVQRLIWAHWRVIEQWTIKQWLNNDVAKCAQTLLSLANLILNIQLAASQPLLTLYLVVKWQVFSASLMNITNLTGEHNLLVKLNCLSSWCLYLARDCLWEKRLHSVTQLYNCSRTECWCRYRKSSRVKKLYCSPALQSDILNIKDK